MSSAASHVTAGSAAATAGADRSGKSFSDLESVIVRTFLGSKSLLVEVMRAGPSIPCTCSRHETTRNAKALFNFEHKGFRRVNTDFTPSSTYRDRPDLFYSRVDKVVGSTVVCNPLPSLDEPIFFQATIYCAGGIANSLDNSHLLTGHARIQVDPETTILTVILKSCTELEVKQK